MDIIDLVKRLTWAHWLERSYNPFIASLTFAGVGRKYYELDGLDGFDEGFVFQNNVIYYCKEKRQENLRMIGPFLEKKSIFDITAKLRQLHEKNKKAVRELIDAKIEPIEKLRQLREISRGYNPFLWITGTLEEYYSNKFRLELPKYVSGDVEEFMAAVSHSNKKTVSEKMQDDLLAGVPAETIKERYGWTKSRDGFTDFYTLDEIEEIRKHLSKTEKAPVDIPNSAKALVATLQELVFYRTDRTDKFYEILGVSRPIYEEVAKEIRVGFKELAAYDVNSIINKAPKKYANGFCYLFLEGEELLREEPILEVELVKDEIIKGAVAFAGKVRGPAKIVKHSSEISKVNVGDILVAQMTLPSFILAMNKATAFVTDEGSITCHAAILAREMKKPCIIGTKIATKVLKDGDLVEVDADRGVVIKIDKI